MNLHYTKLLRFTRETYALRSATGLLSWDQETMMPPGGAEGRADSLAALSNVIHRRYVSEELRGLLEECLGAGDLDDEAQAQVQRIKWDRDRTVKVPEALAEEIARTVSLSQRAWTESKPKNDTQTFNPWLKKVLELRRREAECLGYEESPYDALLGNYEPGAKVRDLEVLFNDLQAAIVPLLHKLQEKNADASRHKFLMDAYPVEQQRVFNHRLLKAMQFDMRSGRLDESAHPFTEGLHPRDVRLTTRYREDDPLSSLFSTLHEGGHGLYEQGFLPVHFGTPLAEAASLGVHESQSRLWENQVGRSRDFWSHYYPDYCGLFPERLGQVSMENFLQAINQVQPSLVRVEADEVTYNLHIILRFQLELALFNRDLEVEGLEEAWNQGMEKHLGIVPSSAADGYMQDVHWSCGLLGYFPTYTLGNIYASQLFVAINRERPQLREKIRAGYLGGLKDWLAEKIHRHGRRYQPVELIELATGEKPSILPFIEYLKTKYGEIYGLSPFKN